MATLSGHSQPQPVPQIERKAHAGGLNDPAVKKLLERLDEAFKLDRDEKDKYVTTKYAAPTVEDGDDTEMDDDGEADEEEETEEDRKEQEERDEFLRQGAERALNLPAKAIVEMPEDVARIAEQACCSLRDVWREGVPSDMATSFKKTNQAITEMNKVAGRPLDAHQIPYTMLTSLIPEVRKHAVRWGLSKIRKDLKTQNAYSKETTMTVANMLDGLAPTGLSWKLLVTEPVASILLEISREGAPLLSNGVAEKVVTYIQRDWELASAAQHKIAQQAEKPLRNLFKCLDQKKLSDAKEEWKAVDRINSDLVQYNRSLGLGETAKNTLLPVNQLKLCLGPQNSLALTDKRQTIAKQLSTFGYAALAQAAVPEGVVVEEIVLTPAAQKTLEMITPRLLKYRDPEPGEESEPAATSDESSSSGASAGSTSEEPLFCDSDTTQDGTLPDTPSQATHAERPQTPEKPPQSVQTTSKDYTVPGHPNRADPQPGGKPFQSAWTGLRTSAVPGPVFHNGITVLGKVTEVQATGREGYRAIVNVGTDNIPVYRILPGASFGRGTCAELYKTRAAKKTEGIKTRTAIEVRAVKAIVEVESNVKHRTREPITKFLVAWKSAGEDTWVTRSDMITLCGREYEERTRAGLLEIWHSNRLYLEEMKKKGLHPETEEPLRNDQKDSTPWLFDHVNTETSREKSSKKSGREQQTAVEPPVEPPVESKKFGNAK